MKAPKMIVLYITTWQGISIGAEHYYGKIILIDSMWKDITLENIEEYGIDTFGENIRLEKELTFKDCENLDKKDGGHTYKRAFKIGINSKSDRFDTIKEITEHGIKFWKEYCSKNNIKTPFISLFHGEKTEDTVILTSDELENKNEKL